MASGDFLCTEYCLINVEKPYLTGSYVLTQDGYTNIYDDGQGGCYSQFFGYCPYGYYFYNNIQVGDTGILSDVSGCFCYAAYSDGTGYAYWNKIYYKYNSGVILCSINLCINIENLIFANNGVCNLIANGSGGCFYSVEYCPVGYSLLKDNLINYISDGTGSYCVVEQFLRETKNVTISWDFSKTTKLKYNFINLDACGSDLLLPISNTCNYFYEINSICQTTVCLFEPNQNKPLFIEDINIPFIYFKNNGSNTLDIKLSRETCFDNFKNCQIYIKDNYINKNISLNSNESILVFLNSSTDGINYYSIVCYPFGFFYEFLNVENVNKFGLFPACCVFDICNNKYIPTYTYSNLNNLPIESGCIVDTGYAFNYKKQLSFYENLNVDCGVFVEISFEKITGTGNYDIFCIQKNLNLNSYYGCNSIQSIINTNSLSILDENQLTLIDENCNIYLKEITSDTSVKIIYDVDFEFNKNYNLIYLDCVSGNPCYDYSVIKKNLLNECFTYTKQDILNSGNIIELKNSETAFLCLYLYDNAVIKSLSNKIIDRNNLYLPSCQDFLYNYCFELNKSNFIKNKSETGFWSSGTGICVTSGFCNYSFILENLDLEYQQYKSNIYKIKLCNQDNRIYTSSIQDKSSFVTSDDFYISPNTIECCFYFCDLEFRYYPVQSVLYRNNIYSIPDDNIQIEFCVSGSGEVISFPKNALNFNKLKINTNFEIFDSVECSCVSINYLDFSFNKEFEQSNYFEYSIPIIQCQNLSGYEYPQVLLSNNIKQIKQTNIDFDINPFNCFISDSFYGLNNFLLFFASKLNSGIALDFINCQTKQMCDYCYNSYEYNFLMMDLRSEYDCCNYTIPTGLWTNILQTISLDSNNNLDIISYKNNTGNGYNYIIPIVNEIEYTDTFTGDCCIVCSQIIQSGLLNYISTGINYDGLATEIIYLFDTGQNLTGCYVRKVSGSYFGICNNNYLINLQSNDLTGNSSCRIINFNRNYAFTGLQPFYIISNYPMLDIKFPIVCNDLNLYCSNVTDSSKSGLYYYLYDINNPKNVYLKLLSPEFTYITDICWNNKTINFLNYDSKIGQIQNNSARINLNINEIVYENPYILNDQCIQNICINIIGGL